MASSWMLISGGSVIDGTSASALEGASVLIREDRVHAVGGDLDLSVVPRGEPIERIDAAGKTVMPGLVDAHCHMTYGESRFEEEIDLYTSHERRTLIAAANAKKVLRAGVTAISQPGGSYFIGVGIRDAIADRLIEGPRMTAAGRYLSTSNSLTDWYPDEVGVPAGNLGVLTNNVHEMVSEVRHQVKNGVDFIKLADSPLGEYQAFTGDEMKAIADLAHQLKRAVTIHARGSAELEAAVDAGFDWIMHGNAMSDEAVGKLAGTGTPLVPTLLLLSNLADFGEPFGVPAPLRDGCKRLLESSADSYHRAHKAGVTFALGTDTGFAVTPYGEWHARELELLMTYGGLTAMEAIQAGTRNGAKMLNMEGMIGQLTPGAFADVIVVSGDPVKDIRVLQDKRNIETVIKAGRAVRFRDDEIETRWTHDRGLIYSIEHMTYDGVFGSGQEDAARALRTKGWNMARIDIPGGDPENVPFDKDAIKVPPGDGKELAAEIKPRTS
jgi:imidazolonepropionase-like amidohydrolase